jgi:hypothetical protein
VQHQSAHAAGGIALKRYLGIHRLVEKLVLGRSEDRQPGLPGGLEEQPPLIGCN